MSYVVHRWMQRRRLAVAVPFPRGLMGAGVKVGLPIVPQPHVQAYMIPALGPIIDASSLTVFGVETQPGRASTHPRARPPMPAARPLRWLKSDATNERPDVDRDTILRRSAGRSPALESRLLSDCRASHAQPV